jgi:hypothetical protein
VDGSFWITERFPHFLNLQSRCLLRFSIRANEAERGLNAAAAAVAAAGVMAAAQVIVNVMTPAARDFYDLEGLWRNGEPIPMDHIVGPLPAGTSAEPSEEAEAEVGADEGWGSFDPFSKVGLTVTITPVRSITPVQANAPPLPHTHITVTYITPIEARAHTHIHTHIAAIKNSPAHHNHKILCLSICATGCRRLLPPLPLPCLPLYCLCRLSTCLFSKDRELRQS